MVVCLQCSVVPSVSSDVILHLPLALLVLLRLTVEKSLQQRELKGGLGESWFTHPYRVEVCIQSEIFTQSVWDLLLHLLRGGVHRDVQVRVQIFGDPGNISPW